ncbi:MAG: DUF4268 domain-containing protein [Thermoguttaceae bacterium]|jgi:uncharacterized protein with ParB-like and HNH nuclease domain
MKGSAEKFAAFIKSADLLFIPVYQRNYDWSQAHCRQLFSDLVSVVKDNRPSHFFGSIVSKGNVESTMATTHVIIDGQQRLTTITLLMWALHRLLERGEVSSANPKLAELIYDVFHYSKYVEPPFKLRPVKDDMKALKQLYSDPENRNISSNLSTNYEFFCRLIRQGRLSADELYEAVWRLEVIHILLGEDDDPQLIFESLNSTGRDLTEADKIRNFILMELDTKRQTEYYEKYWHKIEVLCRENGQSRVSEFIRDYLRLKTGTIPRIKALYNEFKQYVRKNELDTEKLLAELLAYAKQYEIILSAKSFEPRIDACLYRLRRLKLRTPHSFFLDALRLYEMGDLSVEDLIDVFQTSETYLFRKKICSNNTDGPNRVFAALPRDILRYDGTTKNYVGKFKYTLQRQRGSSRFPDDEEFERKFSERGLYEDMSSEYRLYTLERLENYGTKETNSVYADADSGSCSIEHIMPQKLSEEWRSELGLHADEVHKKWLHRAANLTLTGYNPEYSNLSFLRKKAGQEGKNNGYIHSKYRLTRFVGKQSQWTVAELEERDKILSERALQIWRHPRTDYLPPIKDEEVCTLADNVDLTGRSILKFAYSGLERNVSSWNETMIEFLKIFNEEYPLELQKLASSSQEGLAKNFRTTEEEWYKKVIEGVYYNTLSSAQAKKNTLRELFSRYKIDHSSLTFYLGPESEKDSKDFATKREKRDQMRKAYWGVALEKINNIPSFQSFSKTNPVPGGIIPGHLGIPGVKILCSINKSKADVEIRFESGNKDWNKQQFDKLLIQKEPIEEKLGVELTWDRSDGLKSSRVYHRLEGVSYAKKRDWERASDFHAKWSKKFYDVFKPHIQALDA